MNYPLYIPQKLHDQLSDTYARAINLLKDGNYSKSYKYIVDRLSELIDSSSTVPEKGRVHYLVDGEILHSIRIKLPKVQVVHTSNYKEDSLATLFSELGLSLDRILGPLDEKSAANVSINEKNQIAGLIEQLKQNQNEAIAKVKDSTAQISNNTESGLSQITRHYHRSISDLENKTKELNSSLMADLESKTIDSASRLKEQYSKLRYELSKEVSSRAHDEVEKALENAINQIGNRSDEVIENVTETVDSLKQQVSDHIDDFVQLNASLRKTLNFVASDALADSSIKQAEEERKTADTLRSWGVLWLLLSIVLFLLTFDYEKLVDSAGTPQYTLILLRSFFLIIGITPGFYLLRESARHRTDERRYRQKGIQLATIDGYFSEFESEQRNAVKKDLSKHYFHGDDHFVDSSSVDRVESSYSKVFDSVLNATNKKATQGR